MCWSGSNVYPYPPVPFSLSPALYRFGHETCMGHSANLVMYLSLLWWDLLQGVEGWTDSPGRGWFNPARELDCSDLGHFELASCRCLVGILFLYILQPNTVANDRDAWDESDGVDCHVVWSETSAHSPQSQQSPQVVDSRIWISRLRVLRPGCFETFWKNIVIEALCSWKARHAAAAWKKVVYLGSPDSTLTNSDDATHVDCAPGSFHEFCNLCAAASFGGSPTCGFWSNYLIVFLLEALAVCFCCCGDDHDNIEDGGRRRTRATTRTATTRRHQDDDEKTTTRTRMRMNDTFVLSISFAMWFGGKQAQQKPTILRNNIQ